MPDTLAQRIRAKHPGVYDDISDVELEARVRAKYPGTYDDIPSTPTEAAPTQKDSAIPTTPFVAAGVGAAKTVPAVVSGVNKAASAVAKIDPLVASIVGSVAGPQGAAVAASAPKVAGVIQRATEPARVMEMGSRFLKATTKPGVVMRGAGWLSRIAGKAALPLGVASATYDSVQMIDELAKRAADESVDPREREAILQALTGQFVN